MMTTKRASLLLAGAVVALVAITGERAYTQADGPNSAPNPYRVDEGWAKPPFGRGFGSTIGLNVDIDGKSMWIYDRCGGNSCEGSKVAPLIKYDSTGKPVAAIGIGLTNFPHGLFVELHDAGVGLVAMAVGNEDIAVRSYDHVGGCVELIDAVTEPSFALPIRMPRFQPSWFLATDSDSESAT